MFSLSRFTLLLVCLSAVCAVSAAQEHEDRDFRHLRPRIYSNDYLFLPGFPGARTGLLLAPGGANTVTAMPFYLDRYFRVGRVSLSIVTPRPESHAYAGIYDCAGNLLVQAQFPTDAAAALTVTVHPVLLKPGMYYFAIGAEDATSEGMGYLFDEDALNFINSGKAGNPIANGSLPATLKTVTPPQPGSVPTVVFRP